MTKLFIVTENSFEYNDEVYHNRSEGGVPQKAFRDRKKAESFLAEQEVDYWFGPGSAWRCPNHFGYDEDEFYNEDWFDKVFAGKELPCMEVLDELNIEQLREEFDEKSYMDESTFHKITANWSDALKRRFVTLAVCVDTHTIHEVDIDEDTEQKKSA